MDYQAIQQQLAEFPQEGEDPQLTIWQDEPGIVGLCFYPPQPVAAYEPIRKALKGLPIEQRLMPPGDDPDYFYLRVHAPKGGQS